MEQQWWSDGRSSDLKNLQVKRERESKTESEQRLRERVIEGDMKGVAAVRIAYLSWDSNDHPMDCQKSWFLTCTMSLPTFGYVQNVLCHMYSTYFGTCTKRPTRVIDESATERNQSDEASDMWRAKTGKALTKQRPKVHYLKHEKPILIDSKNKKAFDP